MKRIFTGLPLVFLLMLNLKPFAQEKYRPVNLAVAGISHGHSSWILNRKPDTNVVVTGIYERDTAILSRFAQKNKWDRGFIYNNLEKMLDEKKPEAVVAFGSIYEHLEIIKACAPRGIHVMVEKPLATNYADALIIDSLARKHNIHILTNYETSWYPSTEKSYRLLNDSNTVGKLRKAVFHHGHQGPKEIGVGQEFLDWLTDPIQNGGGAIIDFGCYGANIITYLMKGEEPISVTAVTSQFKPEVYPKVDDEATIILEYRGTQAIIQASWNWPVNRKDMELYGQSGYIFAHNSSDMEVLTPQKRNPDQLKVDAKALQVEQDPFIYFARVIRGETSLSDFSLYALPNNMIVVKILDAAVKSSKTGKKVMLSDY